MKGFDLNQSVIRWIDRNVGRLLCFLLTLHRKLCALLKPSTSRGKKCSKIIFIKLIEQGSTVLAASALKKAADLVGKENLFFLVFRKNRPILDILDIVPPSNIIEIEISSAMGFMVSTANGLRSIRKKKIDASIDMEFFSRGSAILSYLSGASKRVGLHLFSGDGPYRGDLFTHRLLYNPYMHVQQFFISMVDALSHDVPEKGPMVFETPGKYPELPSFNPSEKDKASLIQKIEAIKQSPMRKPIIILNPNTSDLLPIRMWPTENFIRLGKMLFEKMPESTIIITGAPEEMEKGDIIASKIGNAVSLSGRTSLKELLVMYSISDVLVTNDSGPAHFSTLTPIKSVILFGPETPLLYGQLKKSSTVMAPDLVCSPCVNVYNHRSSPCDNAVCLRSIKPEDVYEKVISMLQSFR